MLPFFIAYGFTKLFSSPISMNLLSLLFGFAAFISPSLTYFIGKYLNKEEINHVFCEIRFEHWAFIIASLEFIIGLGIFNEFVQSKEFGQAVESIVFWSFACSVLVLPIVTIIFVRKYKRIDAKSLEQTQ